MTGQALPTSLVLSAEQVAEIAALHAKRPGLFANTVALCRHCLLPFPCDAARLAASHEVLRREYDGDEYGEGGLTGVR